MSANRDHKKWYIVKTYRVTGRLGRSRIPSPKNQKLSTPIQKKGGSSLGKNREDRKKVV